MASAGIPTYFYRAMEVGKILPVEAPTRAPRQWQPKPARTRLPPIRIILASVVILTQGMISRSEGQTLPAPDGGSRVAKAEPSPRLLVAAQGRTQPGYQVFAQHCSSPSIAVVNGTTLEIGGKQKIDVSRLDQLAAQEKETLAGQLDVPVGVVDTLLENFSQQAPADATEVAGKLRATVIDYKYLLERWTQYRPPTGTEKVKTDALLALRGGDMDKAWKMYIDLPRPEPPTGFRIAGGDLPR
jgi:hypothetical protein